MDQVKVYLRISYTDTSALKAFSGQGRWIWGIPQMFGICTIARYSFEKRRNHLRCQQNYSTNIVSGNERCQYTPVETRNFSQARDNLPTVTFKRSSRLSIQQLLREQSDFFVYSPARAEGPLLLASKTHGQITTTYSSYFFGHEPLDLGCFYRSVYGSSFYRSNKFLSTADDFFKKAIFTAAIKDIGAYPYFLMNRFFFLLSDSIHSIFVV